ncbi:BatD family protein [Candidatus Omnitrophota bacterium]
MKPRVGILITAFICLSAVFAFAETKVEAQVDKDTLSTDELLTYKLVVTTSEKKLASLAVASFDGFKVVSKAQSSTVSFAKGKARSVYVYVFMLSAQKTGKLTIGASCVEAGGKKYSAESFKIRVTKGKVKVPKAPDKKSKEPQYIL